jgi:hypothetical protein
MCSAGKARPARMQQAAGNYPASLRRTAHNTEVGLIQKVVGAPLRPGPAGRPRDAPRV